jgi:hypothetical protein
MKKTHLSAIAFALASLTAGQAFADDHAPKTRDQVRAELAEARKYGDVLTVDETGLTAREQRPDLYPAKAFTAKSRSQVKAELAEAVRTGNIVADGETGAFAKDVNPGMYDAHAGHSMPKPQKAFIGKTRAAVLAELAEAKRTGDIRVDGESGLTAREMRPDLYN